VIRRALLVLAGAACGCVALGPGVADPRTMANVRDGPGGTQILYLVAASPEGVLSGPLAAGVSYRVNIEGTISLWRSEHYASLCAGTPLRGPEFATRRASGPVTADAEWVWAWGSDSPSLCPAGHPVGPPPQARRVVVVRSSDGHGVAPLPLPAERGMTSDHAYSYVISGTGAPIVFVVDDAPMDDNYGAFRIRISPQEALR